MIVYDGKKWATLFSTIFKTFRESYNLKKLLRFMLYTAIYTSIVTTIHLKYFMGVFVIDTVFFSLIGVILSLFLVFRINTAYDRWWEGRKAWGKLINDSRSFALNLDSLIPADDQKMRNFFVKSIANFALALTWHLRDNVQHGHLIFVNMKYNDALEKAEHVPNIIVSFMYHEIEHMYEQNLINPQDKKHLKEQLLGFTDVLGICERIHRTPIPFSHSTFIKMFTIIYILILPVGLVDVFEYMTIPAVFVMAFAMLGVEIISEEIENPFGLDANDLPTSQMSVTIRENVYEILKVNLEYKSVKKQRKEADVLH